MDLFDALDRASDTFAATLTNLGAPAADVWTRPSINPGWSVYDLVNHVVGGNRRYVLLLHSEPTTVVEAHRNDDQLGSDPYDAFVTTAREVSAAFREPNALRRTVHHRKGDRTGADLLLMRVMEHALHGWDLARSIHTDDTIDRAVLTSILSSLEENPDLLTRSGYLATPPATQEGQDRLLTMTGRMPSPQSCR